MLAFGEVANSLVHEISNPLSAIKALVQLLLESILTEKSKSKDIYEGFFDFLLEIYANTVMVVSSMDEDDIKTVISSPLSAIGSGSRSAAPRAGDLLLECMVHLVCYMLVLQQIP